MSNQNLNNSNTNMTSGASIEIDMNDIQHSTSMSMDGATKMHVLDETLKRTASQMQQGGVGHVNLNEVRNIAASFNDPRKEFEYLTDVAQQHEFDAIELNRTYIALRYEANADPEAINYADLMRAHATMVTQALATCKEAAWNKWKQGSKQLDLKLDKLPRKPTQSITTMYSFFLALDKLRGFYANYRTPTEEMMAVARAYVDTTLGFPQFLGTSQAELAAEATLTSADSIISYFLHRFGTNTVSAPAEELASILKIHYSNTGNIDREVLMQRICTLHSYISNAKAPGATTLSESLLKTMLVKVSCAEQSLKQGWASHNIVPEDMEWETLRHICRDKANERYRSNTPTRSMRRGAQEDTSRRTNIQSSYDGQDDDKIYPGRRKSCRSCKKTSRQTFHSLDCEVLKGKAQALAAAQSFWSNRSQPKTAMKTENTTERS
jgi:hypothetical protein